MSWNRVTCGIVIALLVVASSALGQLPKADPQSFKPIKLFEESGSSARIISTVPRKRRLTGKHCRKVSAHVRENRVIRGGFSRGQFDAQ